jgi:serine/threonine protein kinase
MSGEPTEYQSREERRRSRRLSLQRTRPPGEVVGYEIQRFLGAGAYGEVWVGTDRITGRSVAVKFYLHRSGLDWTLLSREVEKLVFLSADRYVVQLLDVGWHAEPPYYVMEYMEHGSLDDLLNERGSLPPEEAVELFREIAVGLTHAHGKGVLHCDLKPANILLDQDHRPRLADFGQSRLSDEQTPALGTLFYMAPEQADVKTVPDARWDVYALGALLYCMLTGAPPHRTDQATERIESAGDFADRLACYRRELAASPKPDLHRSVPGVDRGLAEIIDNCLATSPARRYANAQMVVGALDARDQGRTLRPLLILGLVGPVLLLTIMILFAWNAFTRAVIRSETMVKEQTYKSNEFAAKFIAKSFQAEIADYFSIIEQEAARQELHAALQTVLEDDMLARLNDPATEETQLDALQARFLDLPQSQRLEAYFERRLADYSAAPGPDAPRFASMFVTDPLGTIVGADYADDIVSRSVGRNYSWRTYFHGGPEDRDPVRPTEPPEHIQATHLSAVFKSTTTEKWKVAVSTPVYDRSSSASTFLGVLAMTVNVGDFAVFRSGLKQTDYFAVLIDDRIGERRGTILQHPLFQQKSPVQDFRVPESQLSRVRAGPVYDYRDPLAAAPAGTAYGGDWIAATEPVRLPGRGRENHRHNTTDLLVLVQVSATAATAAVSQLGRRLALDSVSALAVVVFVVIALWYIVYRISGRGTGFRLGRANASGELTPSHNLSTIPVAPNQSSRSP